VASQQAAILAAKANIDRMDAVVLEAGRAYDNTVMLVKEAWRRRGSANRRGVANAGARPEVAG
jgi:hypothetical protein